MTLSQRLFNRVIPDRRDGVDAMRGVDCTEDSKRLSDIFFLFVSGAFLTKVADSLVNPKITLTWLLSALGAPSAMISLLVPVRESLSMLPQLWMAGPVNESTDQRRFWQLSTSIQAASVLGMAVVAVTCEGALAGGLIIAFLIVFSLGRCLASLVSKTVLAEHMPKTLRGQTTGWGASIAGLAVLLVGGGLFALSGEREQISILVSLLLAASGSWLLATVLYGCLKPGLRPGLKSGPKSGLQSGDGDARPVRQESLAQRIEAVRRNPDFVRFVMTRALLMSSALVAPYYLLIGDSRQGALGALAGLIMANALASLVSSPFWGRFSDRSSRQVLMLAGTMVAVIGALTTFIALVSPGLVSSAWLVPALYFSLELSHQGIRIGRKTYLVDLADDEQRVDYVAVSNTAIGALLLLAGLLLSALSSVVAPLGIIALLSLTSLAGAWLGTGLPEVEVEEH